MRLFEFEALHLSIDNPGGEWLFRKQQECKKDGTNQFGAPNRFGPVTASFERKVLLPVKLVSQVSGIMGEQDRTREDDFAWLKKEMGENNRLPLFGSGNQYAPFIMVDYTGIPWVNEGNHRIKVAQALGWKYIPIELRYFVGGEEAAGSFSPEKVKNYDSTALSLGYQPGNDFQGQIVQKS